MIYIPNNTKLLQSVTGAKYTENITHNIPNIIFSLREMCVAFIIFEKKEIKK